MSQVVIINKVAVCTSQPEAFNEHLITPEHSWTSDRPQKPASEIADQSTFGSGVVVISLFIDEAIDWQ